MELKIVSLETAKELKEVGFNLLVPRAYIGEELCTFEVDESNTDHTGYDHTIELDEFDDNWNKENWLFTKDFSEGFGVKLDNKKWFEAYSAPTLSLIQMWLREKYEIIVTVELDKTSFPKYQYSVSKFMLATVFESVINPDLHRTYDETLEAGIQIGIKLIKTK